MWINIFLVSLTLVPWVVLSERRRKHDLRSRGTVIYAEMDCPSSCTCPLVDQIICEDCEECPRQLGEPCSQNRPCDIQRELFCKFKHDGDTEGVCRESAKMPCLVHNRTYEHGEIFTLDCRTQCACQNGTYGCSSLCPQEHISPKGNCQHPRLVDLPGQCCREWMCDSQTAEQPPSCQPSFSRWSKCNSECGAGLSTRKSNLNAKCVTSTEIRLCQTRRCQEPNSQVHWKMQHHLRRGHECKATHRLSTGAYFRFGPCRSRKRFRPKYCGLCPIAGVECSPSLSTTVKVEFVCNGGPVEGRDEDEVTELLPEYLEPGEDLWTDAFEWKSDEIPKLMTISVQWVLKCRCESKTAGEPTTSSAGEVILHRVHRTAAP